MPIFDTDFIANPRMPWGKYGPTGEMGHTLIADLPDDYLLWLLEKAENNGLKPTWLNETVKELWKERYEKKEEANREFKEEAERLRKENDK
jgi:uncharacterized protein (DUF3820 family)